MRTVLSIILLTIVLAANGPCALAGQVTVSTIEAVDDVALGIEFSFTGDADGTTRLTMPVQWGPDSELGNLYSEFAAAESATGDAVAVNIDGAKVSLRHAPNARLTFSYVVRQDYAGEPSWEDHRLPGMRPVLQRHYISMIGHTVFPTFETPRSFTLDLSGLDGDGTLAFSLPLDDTASTEPHPLTTIKNAIIVAGDFRYSETERAEMVVRTAIRGSWSLSDRQIVDVVSSVLIEAAKLFDDRAFEQYLVVINTLPALPEGSAVVGTGLTESFLLLATANAEVDNLRHTIVHEILHEWIARRMGATDEETDPLRMWFTEGFTEYYTQLVMLRSGLVSAQGFVQNLNELALNYQKSSVKTATNEAIMAGIWQARELERLPYQRGALLALHWDTILRSKGGAGLAGVLAGLIDTADESLGDDEIAAAMTSALGSRFAEDYDSYIVRGDAIPLNNLALPACLVSVANEEGIVTFALDDADSPEACAGLVAE